MRILLVEDNAAEARLTTEALQDVGVAHELDLVRDGEADPATGVEVRRRLVEAEDADRWEAAQQSENHGEGRGGLLAVGEVGEHAHSRAFFENESEGFVPVQASAALGQQAIDSIGFSGDLAPDVLSDGTCHLAIESGELINGLERQFRTLALGFELLEAKADPLEFGDPLARPR